MQISLDFFANAVRALMRKRGLSTQKEAAELLGVTDQRVRGSQNENVMVL